MPGARTLAPQMVGRHAELQALDEHLQQARTGSGRVVLIAGEAGVGKTRLARAFTERAREQVGTETLLGHCYDEDPAVPYGPFIDALRSFLRSVGAQEMIAAAGPWAGNLARLLPELAPRVPPGATATDPLSQKRQLFAAIHAALQPRGAHPCHIVVLEDLHWADRTSQELVRYLARAIDRDRMLILGTYRTEEVQRGHSLTHLIAELTRERLFHEVPLSPLARDDTARMMAAILTRPPPDAVVHLLYEHTGGNPFFVEETLKALIARDGFDTLFGSARPGASIAHIAIPPSLKEAILSRTADLDATTGAVLAYAAVIGRRFDFDLLLTLTGLEEEALLRAIAALVERQLVGEEGDGFEDRYAFRHALTRAAIYDDLLGRERRMKHHAVLDALEAAHAADHQGVADQLAYHSLQAGEREKAARYARLAGARAERMSAYREAIAHYETVLELLEGDAPRERADLYDMLAEAAYPLGDADLYLRYWQEAQRLYGEVGDRRKVADIYRRLGRVAWERGAREDAFAHTRAALAVLEAEPPGRELAMAYSAFSQLSMLSAHPRDGIVWGKKALRLADELGDDGVRAHALNNIGCALCQLGETTRGIAALEESLALAQRGGLVFDALRACLNLGDLFLLLGEFRRAQSVSEEGAALAERVGWQPHRGQLLDNLATAKMALGAWDPAHALLDRIIRSREIEAPVARLFAMRTKSELVLRQGRPEDARRLLEEILPLCETQGEFQILGRVLHTLACTFLALGDRDRAATVMDRCIALWGSVETLVGPQDLLGDSVEVYLAAGREHDARQQLENLSLLVERTATPLAQARIEDARGLVAAHDGRHREATGHFQRAITLWREMACPYEEAKSRQRRADSLLQSGDADAREEAGNELAAAHETFHRLGARLEVAAVNRAMKRFGLGPRLARSAAGHGGILTPREREVIALIARGLSNREIAEELFISRKTTEIHVGNILSKLACVSRAQAAAYAVAHGLAATVDAS